MKCEVNSGRTHDVLISKEISYKSFKEICSGEKTKVNLGFNNDPNWMFVENNTLMEIPKQTFKYGERASVSHAWEIFKSFFSLHNIEPTWLNCDWSWGWYNPDLGGWTGCMGKV